MIAQKLFHWVCKLSRKANGVNIRVMLFVITFIQPRVVKEAMRVVKPYIVDHHAKKEMRKEAERWRRWGVP